MEEHFSLQDFYDDRLETARLTTRFLTRYDVEAWSAFFQDDDAIEFLMPRNGKSNSELSTNWINRQLNRYTEGTFGLQAILDKKTKKIIGQAGLLLQKVDGKFEVEVGYHIIKEYWGQGFATEAAKLFTDFALDNQLAKSVISIINTNNVKSMRVAEKNGFLLEKEIVWNNENVKIYRSN